VNAAPPVVLLMGPTGAGKTDLALELAAHLPAEIVSVDSAMVYRGLDIGTAKPGREIRERIPHHLVDLLDPSASYSAGQFLRDALRAIEAIQARARIPLLVGGTMLYFHSLLNGLARLPSADAGIRRSLDARLAAEGPRILHEELQRVDPEAAARIHPNDPQRIQRALEVHQLTGRPISALQRERPTVLGGMRVGRFVISPRREELHERIKHRFEAMMSAGFLDEVRALHRRGDLTSDKPAVRAVGYRQLWQHLEGRASLDQAVHDGIVATRRLAKRQMTWLRALPRAEWLNSPTAAGERILAWLAADAENE
jgi:tRNA dimethylallyltransferase